MTFESLTKIGANIVVILGAIGAGVGAAVAYLKNRGRNW